MLQQFGIVALGGALGATLRYAVSEWVSVESFPYATLSVNLIGSFLLGVLAVGLAQNLLSANMALLLGMGVLGAFTTMSTFSLETVQMFEQGKGSLAIVYVALTMALGPLLALLGWKIGESIFV
ncbi:MAG: fluoride efflux transporter CrcB [Candidatus Poseidoniales archaeon]|jgi:CrcB protein